MTGQGPGGSSAYTIGGSYGGRGSGASAPTYGSYLTPTALGSAGGGAGGWALGGGAIRLIVSGTLTNQGAITANGTSSAGSNGGASGGSVYVTTGVIAGSGTFSANGKQGGNGAGGGGRVAIYYTTNGGFDPSLATATTGTSFAGATAGSVIFVDSTANNVRLPNGIVVLDPYSTATFHDVSLEGDATVVLGGQSNLHADGTLVVGQGTKIVVQATDNTVEVMGAWIGRGATIVAENLEVVSGGSITADAQGYITGQGRTTDSTRRGRQRRPAGCSAPRPARSSSRSCRSTPPSTRLHRA